MSELHKKTKFYLLRCVCLILEPIVAPPAQKFHCSIKHKFNKIVVCTDIQLVSVVLVRVYEYEKSTQPSNQILNTGIGQVLVHP